MNTLPRFEHDCKKCHFLGQYEKYDLYWCETPSELKTLDSLLARYGNDGPEYLSSCPPGAFIGEPSNQSWYVEILKRGEEKGLYNPQVAGTLYEVRVNGHIKFSKRGAQKEAEKEYEKYLDESKNSTIPNKRQSVFLLIGREITRFYFP